MGGRFAITRRMFLATSAVLVTARAFAQAVNSDRGIGGTGVHPGERGGGDDRGIGGTGVIGTIRRFGSIYVNDLRITFPKSVAVRIDDRRATLRQVKLGHVVSVLAERRAGVLATRLIHITSEVVGPVEAIAPDGLTVLGQSVIVEGNAKGSKGGVTRTWSVGDVVAVSGLRRLDGSIVASLVERRRAGLMRVSGPALAMPDGRVMIGALPIAGLDPTLVGGRVCVTGRRAGGLFQVDRADGALNGLLALGPANVSIEGYVAQCVDGLRVGSGVSVENPAPAPPGSNEAKAVVTAEVEPNGALRLAAVRFEGGGHGSDRSGNGPGPPGLGAPFGHAPAGSADPGSGNPIGGFGHAPAGPADPGSGNPMGGFGPNGGFGAPHGPPDMNGNFSGPGFRAGGPGSGR